MKNTLLLAVLTASLATAQAQQTVRRENVLKIAFMVSLDLKQMLGTPIPTDPDVKRPVAVREGEYGILAMPESKLSAEGLAKAAKEVVPVGQLWLRKLTPQSEGAGVKAEKLLQVKIASGDNTETAILCALGARKDASGKLDLLIYGKDATPVAVVPLKAISAAQENPIEISADVQGTSAVVTLKIAGKFEATFTVVAE